MDYYRGMTKSVYEKEPIFRDFARNIPLSQGNVYDNTNIAGLKRDFRSILATRNPAGSGAPDPLKPSAGRDTPYQPVGEALARRHRASPAGPCVLPFIYVYHRTARV